MKNYIAKNKARIIAVLVLIAVGLLLCQKTYYALLIALFGVYAIVTTSLDILFGYTGQISLGHAGLFAIGAYSTMRLWISLTGDMFLRQAR